MAKYGNSGGGNKGKKYIKLSGGEVATVINMAKARRFMNWYAAYYKVLARIIKNWEYEIGTDTMLTVFDNIALKGFVVRNYKAYFLLAYHTTLLKARKDKTLHLSRTVSVEDTPELQDLPADDFNIEMYEEVVERLNLELMDYVRANFDDLPASIFEIYIALQPDMSYKKMAQLLGYSESRIYLEISAIKADLRIKFTKRHNFLLSLV